MVTTPPSATAPDLDHANAPESATEPDVARDGRTGRSKEGFERLSGLWLLATIALALGLIANLFDPYLSGEAEVAAGDVSAPTGDNPSLLAGLSPVSYANVDIAVAETRSIPRNRSGQPIIVVELAVRNQRAVQARLPGDMMTLVSEDGRAIPLNRFEFTPFLDRLVAEPGETIQAAAVFRLPRFSEAEPESFSLHFGEPNRSPAVVPLVGEPSDSPFPIELATVVNEEAEASAPTVLTAVSTIDYGAYRAQIGRHLVVVDVDMGSLDPSTGRQRDDWTLGSGDDVTPPSRIEEINVQGRPSPVVRLVFDCAIGEADLALSADGYGELASLAIPAVG